MLSPEELFADFDPAEVQRLMHAAAADRSAKGRAQAIRRSNRHHLRRATAEATLADILPPRFAPGDTWHCISRGDVDALSYLRHAIAGVPAFDQVLISTWCIARNDLEELAAWLDSGRIDHLHLCAGEIFPSQYGDEYEMALRLQAEYGCALTIARNHSKVICAGSAAASSWLVMEGSANVNTNPRIEQTSITNDRALFDFYLEFYRGIRSIDRDRPRLAS